jgi:hypothetical protein
LNYIIISIFAIGFDEFLDLFIALEEMKLITVLILDDPILCLSMSWTGFIEVLLSETMPGIASIAVQVVS